MRRSALIIGAGSYVLGDAYGHGVVLPTLLDEVRAGTLDDIVLAVRSARDSAFWDRLAALQAELGTRVAVREHVFSTPEQLEQLELDRSVAFVCVPDAAHEFYTRFLLEHHVPTWVVKPLTGRGATSSDLERLARDQDTGLFVDYHKRFDVSNRRLKALVEDGQLGRALMYSVQYSQPRDLPLQGLAAWSRDVDVFQYIGCHYVDQLFYLFPAAVPVRVSATGLPGRLAAVGGPRFDLVHAVIDLAVAGRTVRADFQVGWNDPLGAPSKSHQRVEVTFESGRVVADQKERGMEVWRDTGFAHENPYFFQILPDPRRPEQAGDGRDASAGDPERRSGRSVTGYGPESLRAFLAARDQPELLQRPSLPWASQARKTDRLLDDVRVSLEDGGAWVEVAGEDFRS